jgi:hypothetical protein
MGLRRMGRWVEAGGSLRPRLLARAARTLSPQHRRFQGYGVLSPSVMCHHNTADSKGTACCHPQ